MFVVTYALSDQSIILCIFHLHICLFLFCFCIFVPYYLYQQSYIFTLFLSLFISRIMYKKTTQPDFQKNQWEYGTSQERNFGGNPGLEQEFL